MINYYTVKGRVTYTRVGIVRSHMHPLFEWGETVGTSNLEHKLTMASISSAIINNIYTPCM